MRELHFRCLAFGFVTLESGKGNLGQVLADITLQTPLQYITLSFLEGSGNLEGRGNAGVQSV